MDIDFPLILVTAVFVTGIAWFLLKLKVTADNKYLEFGSSFFPVLLLVLLLRSFLYEPFQIPSGSMIPTLRIGDFILVNKYSYGLRLPVTGTKVLDIGQPKRGDVVVFFPPNDERYFIKRLVGLPGDKVEVRNGLLFVNGQEMKQVPHTDLVPEDHSYTIQLEQLGEVRHAMQRNVRPGRYSVHYSITVPEGHYFMMGDNRDNSSDSRDWGPVPEENIVGKAVAVWMHWDEFFSLPAFDGVGSIQ